MFDELLDANRTYSASFAFAGIRPAAARHFALVTCMDTRIEPLATLGLRPGDAKIIRNAGGRVTRDVLRSLALATTYLEVTDVAVMHHTGCALAARGEEDLRSGFAPAQLANLAGWQLLAMPDPDAALRADVDAVRTCNLLPDGVLVEGWRYDVATGEVARLVSSD